MRRGRLSTQPVAAVGKTHVEDPHVDTVTSPGVVRHDTFPLAVALTRTQVSTVYETMKKGLITGQVGPLPPL